MRTIRNSLISIWARIALGSLVALTVCLVSLAAHNQFNFFQNKNLVQKLNDQVIERAELAVDYGVITISNLAISGLGSCSAEALQEIRRTIYLRSAVKDVRVLGENGALHCAGLPSISLADFASFDLDNGQPAGNGSITLHTTGETDSGLLAVAWRFRADLTFLAVLNLDFLMFDAFPAELRDSARAKLSLGRGLPFAAHAPEGSEAAPPLDYLRFSATSERYPLEIATFIDPAALGGWNRGDEIYVAIAGLLVGAVFGALVVAVATRPEDPRRMMEDALKQGQFVPYMQPVFDIATRRIVGCEVLTRWVLEDGTVIPPYRFIPQAEENGLIVPITRSIVTTALKALAPRLESDPRFRVAFNIAPADLVSDGFTEEFADLALAAGVGNGQIVIEITERQQFEEMARAGLAVRALRDAGFHVALDDAGTGHNGLSHIQRLGVNIIKIDKMFVDLAGSDRAADTIIRMLVRLARELGMTTVAEGIESEDRLEALRRMKIDEGQGYLVSPPVPAAQFLALLKDQDTGRSPSLAA